MFNPLTRVGATLQGSMWREASGGLLGRDRGNTHLDAGSQGWYDSLRQELLSHSLALHDKVPQGIQTQLLRAGNKSTALGSSHTKPGIGGGGWHAPVLEAHERSDDAYEHYLKMFLYLPAQAGPKGIYKL